MTILTGGTDAEALSEHSADWLGQQNSSFQRHELGSAVGHYTFLEYPADRSLVGRVDIFTDHEIVDRRKVHECAAKIALKVLR